ncbi:UNVERIFIED_CONTAM: hypothetical protein FKN15_024350 [Acipenser sinensis]
MNPRAQLETAATGGWVQGAGCRVQGTGDQLFPMLLQLTRKGDRAACLSEEINECGAERGSFLLNRALTWGQGSGFFGTTDRQKDRQTETDILSMTAFPHNRACITVPNTMNRRLLDAIYELDNEEGSNCQVTMAEIIPQCNLVCFEMLLLTVFWPSCPFSTDKDANKVPNIKYSSLMGFLMSFGVRQAHFSVIGKKSEKADKKEEEI